jgi:DNA-directed RNA polymerase specialized sigma24 family protein
MAAALTESLFNERKTVQLASGEQLHKFDEWFSRCHKTLQYTACLILGGSEIAEYAVQKCRFRASLNPPDFESEGAFRSWAVRLLISEALSILRQGHTEAFGRKRL